MWKLIREKDKSVYYIIVDEEFTVGRKDCSILIPGDPSVSRKHASLKASHPIVNLKNVEKKPLLMLKDGLSKYGSFINCKQVGSEGAILKHNDVITFGQCGSNFQVVYSPLVITTSCVVQNAKSVLKEDVRKLGGHVIEEWTASCTHLAMTGIKVTVKTVCALISQTPIVTPEYFKELRKCCETNKEPDDSSKFLPPVSEVLLDDPSISFQVNTDRNQIFKDKNFIFLSTKQYSKLKLPIELGEGKPILMNHTEFRATSELLLSSCVVQLTVGGNSAASEAPSQVCNPKEVEKIHTLLKENNKRIIPESDIGLAVVHCSTSHYCNPDAEENRSEAPSEDIKIQSQTLTQSFMHNIIPETINNGMTQSLSFSGTKPEIVTRITETESEQRSVPALYSITTSTQNEQNLTNPKKKRSLESEEANIDEPTSKLAKSNPVLEIIEIKEEQFSLPPSPNSSVCTSVGATINTTGDTRNVDLLTETQQLSASLFKSEAQEDMQETQEYVHIPKEKRKKSARKDTVVESEAFKRQKFDHLNVETNVNDNCQVEEIIPKLSTSARQERSTVNILPGFLYSKLLPEIPNACKEETNTEEKLNFRSNLMVISFMNLTVENVNSKRLQKNTSKEIDPSIKNFKNFKKTAHTGANKLPRIIGGTDLLVFHRNESLVDINQWLREEENSPPDCTQNTSFNAPIRKHQRI